MKNVMVLGSGCTKCVKTAELIEKLAREEGVAVSVSKESDPKTMLTYGVLSTPAIVIDNQLMHSGSMPTTAQIKTWLAMS